MLVKLTPSYFIKFILRYLLFFMTSCAENPNEKPFEIRSFFVCGVFSHISRKIKRFEKFMKKVQKSHLKEDGHRGWNDCQHLNLYVNYYRKSLNPMSWDIEFCTIKKLFQITFSLLNCDCIFQSKTNIHFVPMPQLPKISFLTLREKAQTEPKINNSYFVQRLCPIL